MAITKETIVKTANLANLALTSEEVSKYAEQLAGVLDYVSILDKLDTKDIVPLITPTDMEVTIREDVVESKYSAEEVLSNAPDKSGNLFKVPPVL